ncbi:MAG: DNA-3-methyladenine glycosylase I [Granulosicoccus sp.]
MIHDKTSCLSHEECLVPPGDPVFQRYHDEEWGVPQLSNNAFFEKVCLEGFQSGLSWRTVLHRRKDFRYLFDGFDIDTVACYDPAKLEALAGDSRIIRNRRKIASAINNAIRAQQLIEEYGSLAQFFWGFEPAADSRPEYINRRWLADNPSTPESTALAKALKSRGWSFVGPTNMYALMQALGIVNDHVHGCPRRNPIERLRSRVTNAR